MAGCQKKQDTCGKGSVIDVSEHLGLVGNVINRHFRGSILTFDEMFSAGCIGLVRAGKRFDPELGFRFSTFASRCIYRAIQHEIFLEGRYLTRFRCQGESDNERTYDSTDIILPLKVLRPNERKVIEGVLLGLSYTKIIKKYKLKHGNRYISKQRVSQIKIDAINRMRECLLNQQ